MSLTEEERNAIKAKYAEERQKRVRADGRSQFLRVFDSDKFKKFGADPWVRSDPHDLKLTPPLHDGQHSKFVILGTGFAGILYGKNLLEAGVPLEDIILIDRAAGFGGTWYWNRYPGLMCDVESYVYLPELETTGYVPKHKYSYGTEIRHYANLLASRYSLGSRASFETEVEAATWDEVGKEWIFKVVTKDDKVTPTPITIRGDYFLLAPGLLVRPKLPAIPGIEDYTGHIFHTCRWDYEYTGGNSADWQMTNLKDKKVAIIGTGASAIQAVPELGKWASQLYVVQRTPAGVDIRGQHPTDPETVEKEMKSPNWQTERIKNFLYNMSDPLEEDTPDLVKDQWTAFHSSAALCGGPRAKDLTKDKLEEFVRYYEDMDMKRTKRIRERVDEVVKDPETANSLKAWYASWCKRPCFHDDYLPTFNRANVRLVDTHGAGVTRLTKKGFVVGEEEFEVDLIIFSTGFEFEASNSPASQAAIPITGRNGLSLDEKWNRGVATLHGVMSRDFPNLFWLGLVQTMSSQNYMVNLSTLSKHAVQIITDARKKAKAAGEAKVVVEPTDAAEEAWTDRVSKGALAGVLAAGCTPSYYNQEGELQQIVSGEEQAKMARKATWMAGPLDFLDFLDSWHQKGDLGELEIAAY
ncbi:hypothetical protein Z517_06375 [Fonsecaea pedrosoi CBS 271.37]|uniref:FAD/NAD(P)-binding domain-containing protein n=1 Tax=Fonsecaea pedrosoi CBS 271.37 TaxID=1442368 RepID=A0A0D2DPS6_9EURO|nr:uncharacterized protein Z517_06375 [Fonsecaea pedrosoi CBS 271.37]KIW79761.1 hypothetical protein Z517_06375 [Fonsecaea pedrosoi CBS 271.37]